MSPCFRRTHLQQLRRKGCLFLTSTPGFWQRLGGEPSTSVVTSLREGQALRFVPNGLALAKNADVQQEVSLVKKKELPTVKRPQSSWGVSS